MLTGIELHEAQESLVVWAKGFDASLQAAQLTDALNFVKVQALVGLPLADQQRKGDCQGGTCKVPSRQTLGVVHPSANVDRSRGEGEMMSRARASVYREP